MNRNLEQNLLALADTSSILNGKKVLVVDSYPDTKLLFTLVFEEYGAEVIAVTSASEAMAAIEQSQPDLLISDIRLPDEDGYSLLRRVRNLKAAQGGQMPAIAFTTFYTDMAKQPSASGFQRYFLKPINLDDLIAAAVALV